VTRDASALILAGGKATRFGGIAKHLIEIGGETILARQLRVLAPRVTEVLVSAPADVEGVRTVRDHVDGAGPLAGIAAGAAAWRTGGVLVGAGDMPYLGGELVDALLAHRAGDAVGVRANGLPEPLVCALRRGTLPAVERRLAAGRYKASGLLVDEGLDVAWLDWGDRAALRNVNSPDDLP